MSQRAGKGFSTKESKSCQTGERGSLGKKRRDLGYSLRAMGRNGQSSQASYRQTPGAPLNLLFPIYFWPGKFINDNSIKETEGPIITIQTSKCGNCLSNYTLKDFINPTETPRGRGENGFCQTLQPVVNLYQEIAVCIFNPNSLVSQCQSTVPFRAIFYFEAQRARNRIEYP